MFILLNSGDEVRRKWRSLRSGFRRELLARSNKKPKPKTKQWKHFSKLLFLRDSETGRDLSDNEFEDNQQNNSMCINQPDNVSDDFSDLMQMNNSVTNLAVESIENGEIKLNIISNSTDKQDKGCQDDNNTQFKLLTSNLNTTLQPQQIFYVKTNGINDLSPLLLIKKSDQNTPTATNTSQQINLNDEHHHQTITTTTDPQQTQHQITTIKTTPQAPINRTNEQLLINSFKTNNLAVPKNKKRKEEIDEELDANDYFGRMIASLLKEQDPEDRNSIRVAILQLISNWSGQKKSNNNHIESNNK